MNCLRAFSMAKFTLTSPWGWTECRGHLLLLSLRVLQISLAPHSAYRIISFAVCATSGFSHSLNASFDAIWKIPPANHLADRMSQHPWPAWPSLCVLTRRVPGWSQRGSPGTSVVPRGEGSGGQQGWEANGACWDLLGKARWDHPHLSSLTKGDLWHLRVPEESWAQRD